jgi:hypothetical protein
MTEKWGVGHPGSSSTINDQERWEMLLKLPECAERECRSWSLMDDTPIIGHVWSQGNQYQAGTFPDHLKHYCFTCAYWHQRLEQTDEGTVVVNTADGLERYSFDPKHPFVKLSDRIKMQGYGGRLFVIHFFDGRIVRTNDLWHQGDIPSWMLHYFKANARFDNEEQAVKIDWSDL